MGNLEAYLNDDTLSDVDPLVKMAVLHFQFESIGSAFLSVHPFYDGNGRTGRILNILYLVLKGLLDIPVLYLSRYLIRHKAEYYRHLQHVRDTGQWEPWLLYMLNGVEQTSRETIVLIGEMRELMQQAKQQLRAYRFYSQDLVVGWVVVQRAGCTLQVRATRTGLAPAYVRGTLSPTTGPSGARSQL